MAIAVPRPAVLTNAAPAAVTAVRVRALKWAVTIPAPSAAVTAMRRTMTTAVIRLVWRVDTGGFLSA
ncbi:hypothetical protein ACWEPA_17595 [Streptomyces filamentosus]